MTALPSDHFLSLPRPDTTAGPPPGVPDTTTLAAHDFDVDTRTGFMPSPFPIPRLPIEWEIWEVILEQATSARLQLGDKPGLSDDDAARSESWRACVRAMPVLSTENLYHSEPVLRRAHHVLAWIMHFYIQSLPPDAPITIPRTITLPLLKVCAQLSLPPVLTYSDDVLYNWALKVPSSEPVPALNNLRSQTLFTGTNDEQEFYLASARVELRGVEALDLMRATLDELFVGDTIAHRRITSYLNRMAIVINELKTLIVSVRDGCDPEIFYHDIRPWFRGMDSDPGKRPWVFEGLEEDPSLRKPMELSGPSAGQSSIIHALDIFLGVEEHSHAASLTGSSSGAKKSAFLDRMRVYMPRHHRAFLSHLANNTASLRDVVSSASDPRLVEAYNSAVIAMKELRDAHMIIVTLYIVGPARRGAQRKEEIEVEIVEQASLLKGTGGTELVRFLKGVRDLTTATLIPLS